MVLRVVNPIVRMMMKAGIEREGKEWSIKFGFLLKRTLWQLVFSAAFSGERSPYSPAQFLYSWWRHAANLAGYEQQDAHEFFISTADGIHANSGPTSPRARNSQKWQGRRC